MKRTTEPGRVSGYKRQDRGMSVYVPKDLCVNLGGRRSVPMGQAVRCWSQLMVQASLDNERAFWPQDWQALAAVMEGRERSIDPELPRPQAVLADALDQVARIGTTRRVGCDSAALAALAGRVRDLDYLHCWALLWALQWRQECRIPVDSEDAWWTLYHRQQNPLPTRRERDGRTD